MKELTDFQKKFFARGTGATLFTQEEFDNALAVARAEIMQIAINTTKTAISIEREECAKLVDVMRKGLDGVDVPMVLDVALEQLATQIRDRLTKQRHG
jgi:hypothetical protein